MANSGRWSNFIEGKRECRKCGVLKEQKDFHFNSTQGYYMGSCKLCTNKHRKIMKRETPQQKADKIEYLRKYHKENWGEVEYRTTRVLATCKRLDLDRNFKCTLTREYVKQCVQTNCIYCNYPSTGLDRLDNSIGHTNENCVPCCKECNNARMDNFTHEETFLLGEAIRLIKDERKLSELKKNTNVNLYGILEYI